MPVEMLKTLLFEADPRTPRSESPPRSEVHNAVEDTQELLDATPTTPGGRSVDGNSVLGGEERPEWDVELTESQRDVELTEPPRDALSIGDSVRFSKQLTDDDVRAFAEASGDTNRLHLDNEYAMRTRFGRRIVHGTLVSGLISAALARLPGLVIYLSQDEEFRNPVEIGNRVTAECEIIEDLGRHRYRLRTTVTDESASIVIDGEAVVLLD